MRRVLAPLSLLTALLLAGCAGGTGEPETIVVTSTEVVDAPAPESAPEANPETEPESEPAPASEPEQPAAPLAGAFELDPAYKDQVGGKCGMTPDGAKISVGDTTSCDLAAAAYPHAINATWAWSNKPNVTSVPFTNISGVVSPITGGAYDLRCAVGSSGQTMSCYGPDNDPYMTYELEMTTTWHPRINIVGEYPHN
ncbi:hypothetical protein [uncultured Corynebacterium sp.]|uniref:hypothetical protein n=1 Tax=uncultured Corynebacterium sp. TaxID=159447 RepID=UPI0028896B79|nr:hypothetical protein [uncultured Corynebacterium sp.]